MHMCGCLCGCVHGCVCMWVRARTCGCVRMHTWSVCMCVHVWVVCACVCRTHPSTPPALVHASAALVPQWLLGLTPSRTPEPCFWEVPVASFPPRGPPAPVPACRPPPPPPGLCRPLGTLGGLGSPLHGAGLPLSLHPAPRLHGHSPASLSPRPFRLVTGAGLDAAQGVWSLVVPPLPGAFMQQSEWLPMSCLRARPAGGALFIAVPTAPSLTSHPAHPGRWRPPAVPVVRATAGGE